MGLLVPESLTERVHIREPIYHANALFVGGAAGLATVTGLAILLYRRLTVPAVRVGTSRSDRAVYPVLVAVLLAGLAATATTLVPHPYDYRTGVSVWFRSLLALDPDVPAMAPRPTAVPAPRAARHDLFALWPFSRLVHAFTAPLGYLFRPYVVYRSRGAAGTAAPDAAVAPGRSRAS